MMKNTESINGGSCAGYITVFASLILGTLLPLFFLLFQGAVRASAFVEANCISDVVTESLMAEYSVEMLEKYNIFSIDTSYGMGSPSLGRINAHLNNYLFMNTSKDTSDRQLFSIYNLTGIRNTFAETTGVTYITDNDGEVFRDLAVKAVEDEFNISLFKKIYDLSTLWGEYEGKGEEVKLSGEIKEISSDALPEGLKTLLKDTPDEKSPSAVFSLICNVETVSAKSIESAGTLSARKAAGQVNKGNLEHEVDAGIYEKFMFGEYLLRHMSNFTSKDPCGALKYEMEYIIAGKESDEDNLKSVIYRIFLVREGINIAKIEGDEKRCAEADGIATAISLALLNPELQPFLKHGILVLWATKDSRDDLEKLLKGEEVELFEGITLSYEDHLRAMLLLTSKSREAWRGMDMMEAGMRLSNPEFRLDGCITDINTRMIYENRFGHEYEINMRKSYEN
ncbi:MAG: DUF5702 domain-containing protein [Acetatifactor sp.]|nr:DUF5702 domain-containing protein [Acetatifactor sp.]